MRLKQLMAALLTMIVFCTLLVIPASADGEPTFCYELTVDGKDTIEVSTGDIITVTLHLYRTDEEALYTMYAMQDEIRYDSNFFELVEDSAVLSNGTQCIDIDVGGGFREFYMNYVSFSGGAQWQPKVRVGTFQLRVIGTSGVATITNEDYLVSQKDGMSSYECEASLLTVILSTECEVQFETNGGTKIDPVKAIYGEKLDRPEDPVREGKYFAGWYKDIHLSLEWDFDTDVVLGNMTLYAKWSSEPVESESEPDSGDESEEVFEEETSSSDSDDKSDPEKSCPLCGELNDGSLCTRCFIIVLSLILLVIVASVALVLWRRKRQK